jgi:hypothetical protein
MLFALIGSIVAQLTLARVQDRQLPPERGSYVLKAAATLPETRH